MRTRSGIVAMLVGGSLAARPALAALDPVGAGTEVAFVALAILVPAHLGADVPASGDSRFVIGWSFQMPVGREGLFDFKSPHHRIVLGGDLLLGGDTGGRGRLGYRYSTHWLFAGAGVSANNAGVTWSPELGAKFFHFMTREPPALHVLVRGEIEPDLQGVRSATILLGWNFL